MKRFFVVSWFVCAMALIMISCSNKEESAQVSEHNSLYGTTWFACHNEIDTINDTITIFTFDVVAKFLDDTSGVLVENFRIFSNNETELADEPVRTPFTYEYSGVEGSMVFDFNECEGKSEMLEMPKIIKNTFRIDTVAKSITTFAGNGKLLETYYEVK